MSPGGSGGLPTAPPLPPVKTLRTPLVEAMDRVIHAEGIPAGRVGIRPEVYGNHGAGVTVGFRF